MVIALYLLAVLFSVTQSAATKLFNRQASESSVFNAVKASSALLLFALMAVFDFAFHLPTLAFGCLYGLSLCVSMYAGYRALCLGPMALTGMLVSFSVVMPLIWGVAVLGENFGILRGIGLIFLLLALLFTNADRLVKHTAREEKDGYGKWLLFVALTFACNGLCSILQKQHQTLYPAAYGEEFMLFAMLFCALVFTAFALRKIGIRGFFAVKGKRFGVLSGLANGLSNFLLLLLAGMENASVLFPVISAGTVLASLVCGRILFAERLKKNHYLAILFGIASVVLFKY